MVQELTRAELLYAAGFFDGDGCLAITKPRDRIYVIVARVVNVHMNVLEWFKERFGGSITKQTKRLPHHREKWCWTVSGKMAVSFLDKVGCLLQLKKDQASLASAFIDSKEFRHRVLSEDILKEREFFKKRMSDLKDVLDVAFSHELTEEYAAGFFDAEGSVSVVHPIGLNVRISNTIRSVLDKFSTKFGGSIGVKDKTPNRDGYNRQIAWLWYVRSDEAYNFLAAIRPFLIVKSTQAKLGIEYQAKKASLKRGEIGELNKEYSKRIIQLNSA